MDERSTRILALLQEAADYVSLEELMKKLGISRRTVYYDLDKINDWLKQMHLPPVEYVRSAGYYLPEESRAGLPGLSGKLPPQYYYFSQRERLSWLAVQLISASDSLFVHNLTDSLQVSRGTVLKDLNLIRPELKDLRLEVTYDRKLGYRVRGEESDQRKALSHYLGNVLGKAGWETAVNQLHKLPGYELAKPVFPENSAEQLKELSGLIAESERLLGLELTDEMVFSLTGQFLLTVRRIQLGRVITVDEDELKVLRRMPEYTAARQIADGLESMTGSAMPEEEVGYMTMHLLGARLNWMDPLAGTDEMLGPLKNAAREMTDAFQRYACLFLPNREVMEENLLVHLKPAYYRIRYGLEYENPLLENIRSKYGEVFELARRSAGPFEKLVGRKLDDSEISYLAMHFGGWLRRENTQPAARSKAAIVCVNGISASRMLKSQLEHLFSAVDITAVLSLRDYKVFGEDEIDFIFSTIPLPDSRVPVFVVNPILSDKDKEHLLNQVNTALGRRSRVQASSVQALMDIVRKYADIKDEAGLTDELNRYMSAEKTWLSESRKPALADLLPASMIRVQPRASDWRTAIRMASEPLLREGRIEEAYVQAMIDKVEALGPYIVVAPGIAIAHGKPQDGVKRLGMSLLRLEEAVAFSDQERHQVQVILVLAAIDGESHLKALSELTILLREEKSLTRLKEAGTIQELAGLIGPNGSGR
ncbi:BglG family transcription antiterminator [Paenibacillus sp. FJAT-26967]|uniref:BglG family transcription antiterminator n=1 Tax=Paenibacillus sp. FJAT-26967 TaxID=1729690 RepID=UPI002647CE13|nr:BglG family transcription antiterminator [Paenibacillus sp. FJAT-26967]